MFNHHSLIPWGSFRGRQEEKWGSFRGQFGDHFRALGDLVWVISNSFLSLLPKFFGVILGLLIRGRIFFVLSVDRILFFKITYTSPTPQKLNCPSDM